MKTLQTLEERLADKNKTPLYAGFITTLKTIAVNENLNVDEVWMLWEKYVHDCNVMDQSPVMSEFCQWNKWTIVNCI